MARNLGHINGPMPATPDELFASLDRLGIAHPTVTHPPLFTVEQSQALRGTIPGGHTKNLFLKDKKDALFLVVALEDARDRAENAAPPARRHRPFLVRLGGLMLETLGGRARRGDAVRRHQRHGAAASPWCSTPR